MRNYKYKFTYKLCFDQAFNQVSLFYLDFTKSSTALENATELPAGSSALHCFFLIAFSFRRAMISNSFYE